MILEMLRQIHETDEFFHLMAGMMRKLHLALMNVGFTEDQAVQIVAGFAASRSR
jgi:hypothetical protein